MIDKDLLYPLLFKPYYKPVMWGGNNLEKVLHRELPKDRKEPIGESWELCDRADISSVTANGPLAGTTLTELVREYSCDLLGTKYHGGPFPLLVKIIDAGKRLSLQVHPDEEACRTIGGGAQPKTEMWYIIHAEPRANIYAGLRADTTRVRFLSTINSSECENSLQIFESVPGDAYFIKAGRVHAIGAGNLLLEIQQNSDTTYRISDWGRLGSDGKPRQLHLEQAKLSIDYNDRSVSRISGVSNESDHNRKYPIVTTCPFFRVEDLRLTENWNDNTLKSDSFHLLTAINEAVQVGREGSEPVTVPAGCSCLVPACYGMYRILVSAGKKATVIKTSL